ncbi:MAG: DNA-formamidopyrimidine glycosylase family protein [Promethearchaeia archaeon]
MPELPEVESFRNHFDQTSLNEGVKDVIIRNGYILKMDKNKFLKAIKGKTFQSSRRYGKYLFIGLGEGYLLLHFGMSGNLQYFEQMGDEPEYSKIIFQFESGKYLSIISIRKLGKVKIVENLDEYIKEKELGPDALRISREKFMEKMKKKRSYLKTALMDQETICGIGNIYSDEILFQARMHPKKKINKLSDSEMEGLYNNTHDVLETSVERVIAEKEIPEGFLIPHRDKEEKCPQCGSEIKRLKVSNRHGYYCPPCQKR